MAQLTAPLPGWKLVAVRAIVAKERAEGTTLWSVDAPARAADEALVRTRWTGVDRTDEDVAEGAAEPPPGRTALVLGHECLGEVVEAPADADLRAGDVVVPLVRRGCGACAACTRYAAPDLCATDEYRERGIKGLDGFMRDLWTEQPAMLVRAPRSLGRLAVLTEPLSVAIKALEVASRVQRRLPWFDEAGAFRGQRALVAGTGSLGSLAAFLLRHEGMEVWGLDRSADEAAGPLLLERIGVQHINSRARDVREVAHEVGGFDLVLEATGSPEATFAAVQALAKNGVMVLLGVPRDNPPLELDGDETLRGIVLGNQALVGSVNSHRGHFERALRTLEALHARWPSPLEGIVTHTYSPEQHEAAFRDRGPDVIKKLISWDTP
jgi:glucose 1-dehydrogenase